VIVTRTPLRVSLVGGGTDFREFHRRREGGVVTTAIDKYVFVTLEPREDHRIRLVHSETRLAEGVDDVRHRLVRECLRKVGIAGGLDITIRADIPSGTGLGSSSTLIVGLLHALHGHLGATPSPESLAREACEIEIDIVGQPIGVQDQYIAAYGGQRFLRFRTDGRVEVETLALSETTRRGLESTLMLFFTNVSRRSETVLSEQRANISHREAILRELAARSRDARALLESDDLDGFGRQLHEGSAPERGEGRHPRAARAAVRPRIERLHHRCRPLLADVEERTVEPRCGRIDFDVAGLRITRQRSTHEHLMASGGKIHHRAVGLGPIVPRLMPYREQHASAAGQQVGKDVAYLPRSQLGHRLLCT